MQSEQGKLEKAGHEGGKTQLVAVSALTYDRPELLPVLLAAMEKLAMPPDMRLAIIIVDNDPNGGASYIVEGWQDRFDALHYVNETRRGIPVARNRALKTALQIDADALCFIDDDEYPDERWLVELVKCWRNSGVDLLGGPVEVASPPRQATGWQRFVNASLAARMFRKNLKTAEAARRSGRYTVVTNNWLCDLEWQRRASVWFDETLLVSGGSDTAFFRAAKEAGGQTGWCASAKVYETILPDRLSFAYQFDRGAAQSMTNFRIKHEAPTIKIALKSILAAMLRFVLGLLLLVVPIYGVASPVIAVRSVGWAFGRIRALRGEQSKLYK